MFCLFPAIRPFGPYGTEDSQGLFDFFKIDFSHEIAEKGHSRGKYFGGFPTRFLKSALLVGKAGAITLRMGLHNAQLSHENAKNRIFRGKIAVLLRLRAKRRRTDEFASEVLRDFSQKVHTETDDMCDNIKLADVAFA